MSLFETFFILQGRRPNEGNFSDAFLQTIPSNGEWPASRNSPVRRADSQDALLNIGGIFRIMKP